MPLSWLTLNAFTASDKIIIVVSPGYFELDSIVQINKTIEKVKLLCCVLPFLASM